MPIAVGRYVFTTGVSAFFEMPTSDARRILPEHLQPVEVRHERSILAVTAYPNRTSPVLRGKWVLENLLGAPPPEPPPSPRPSSMVNSDR